MAEKKEARKPIDWEAVEREYRIGVRSLRDIADEFGCSHVAIKKRADKENWVRDLSAKISAQVNSLVTRDQVTNEVTVETKATERALIDANAKMIADKVLNQREDIKRARAIVQKLWAAVESEIDYNEEFEKIGALLRSEDDFGQDKMNDAYCYAISLPQKVKSVKLLADALKVLIELERKVLKIDTTPDPETTKNLGEAIGKGMGECGRSILADVLAELNDDETAA